MLVWYTNTPGQATCPITLVTPSYPEETWLSPTSWQHFGGYLASVSMAHSLASLAGGVLLGSCCVLVRVFLQHRIRAASHRARDWKVTQGKLTCIHPVPSCLVIRLTQEGRWGRVVCVLPVAISTNTLLGAGSFRLERHSLHLCF